MKKKVRIRFRKPGSERDIQDLINLAKDFYNGTKAMLQHIQEQMKDKLTVTDEMFRFMKRGPSNLEYYMELISKLEAKQTAPLTKDMPEKMQKFIKDLEWMLTICKDKDVVIDDGGYYLCNRCGFLHSKGRQCMYIEYQDKHKLVSDSTADKPF